MYPISWWHALVSSVKLMHRLCCAKKWAGTSFWFNLFNVCNSLVASFVQSYTLPLCSLLFRSAALRAKSGMRCLQVLHHPVEGVDLVTAFGFFWALSCCCRMPRYLYRPSCRKGQIQSILSLANAYFSSFKVKTAYFIGRNATIACMICCWELRGNMMMYSPGRLTWIAP